jgi:hypothetical protein
MDRQPLLARRWLRLDAVYCAAAGAIVVALSVPLGRLFHIPPSLAALIGGVTLVWALLLAHLASRQDWQQSIRLVVGANAAASLGLLALGVIAPTVAARLLLVAVAVEVAAFAVVQLRTLGR